MLISWRINIAFNMPLLTCQMKATSMNFTRVRINAKILNPIPKRKQQNISNRERRAADFRANHLNIICLKKTDTLKYIEVS